MRNAEFVKQVGNIRVFKEDTSKEGEVIITFYNGSDAVCQDLYKTDNVDDAIDDLFKKCLDTYTRKWLLSNGCYATSKSLNTYKQGDMDWFCQIDDTGYYKHYYRKAEDFIRDKDGLRIIDR